MKILVDGYTHRTGEHCASTALRNILDFHGLSLTEPMIFGLASGLGFFNIAKDGLSPSRMFHGRTVALEEDFGRNTGVPFVERPELDDDRAFNALKDRIDAGQPVMISTDTFYLKYHHTRSHFPGHRAVVVGYDPEAEQFLLADRKFEAYQACGFDELRQARNASDYPASCENRYGDFLGTVELNQPWKEILCAALRRCADNMLTPDSEGVVGIGGMRALAAQLPDWQHLEDWSWSARFGYQVIVKRGAGGSFFRSLYAEFLEEATPQVPALAESGLPGRMHGIAADWCALAELLKEQSERDTCEPQLFVRAGQALTELADDEERLFNEIRAMASVDADPEARDLSI